MSTIQVRHFTGDYDTDGTLVDQADMPAEVAAVAIAEYIVACAERGAQVDELGRLFHVDTQGWLEIAVLEFS